MQIYPAIDIKDGKCVRLSQGDFDKVTVFNENPIEVAKSFEEQGATFIHLVDLDGARKGSGYNDATIKSIVESINIPVDLGGGIRTMEDIDKKIELGISRVILGTTAIKNKEIVKEAVEKYGDKIAVGIDAKNGYVAISGWEEVSQVTAMDLAKEMIDIGVKYIIYTDISKDGMMSGPNLVETKKIVDLGINVIASGGISKEEDVADVKAIGCEGVIIGKAIYMNSVNLAEVVKKY